MGYNWDTYAQLHNLSQEAVSNLSTYARMIIDWNTKFNLTTIVKEEEIAQLHFEDSLSLKNIVDLKSIKSIADIGTGAGIPGLPLKICYPHLALTLIEVVGKKRSFLQAVVDELKLKNVEIIGYDWLTFLRKTEYPIDLFCARASLAPDELIKMFKNKNRYAKSILVYWASKHWQPSAQATLYIQKTHAYTVMDRTYNLIKMAAVNNNF